MENLEIKYKETTPFSEKEISDTASSLMPYLSEIQNVSKDSSYGADEASLFLPFDTILFQKTRDLGLEFNSHPPKYIIVVGIGGSNLGAQAVYEAIRPKLTVALSHYPRLIFSDTNNPREMEALMQFFEKKVLASQDALLNIITKSGTTTETVANASLLFSLFAEKFGEEEALHRIVITTDENSSLHKIALQKNIKVLPIPKKVGGRFSVFSPVGLFPLFLAGLNTDELVLGAREVMERCFLPLPEDNPALLGASLAFLSHKKGESIYNNFFFNSELETLGKWWRQLTAESLGKKYDNAHNTVFSGMTPIVSIGSTDLHSMVQLYFGGPRDKFTNFISAGGGQEGHALLPKNSLFEPLAPDIFGKDFSDIMQAILLGTKSAYQENDLPFIETILPDISERSLGQYMQMKMIETLLLARLWNINAFDQPEVESYKKVTKELLKQ